MANIRFCGLSIVALMLGSTSGWQEPGTGVLRAEQCDRKVDFNNCIYLVSVDLVAPREPLPEGVRFHLPNYVRVKLGDMLLLRASYARPDDITGIDATIQGVAVERVGEMYSGAVTPDGNVIPVPSPPFLLLRTTKTGKSTLEAVVRYKGGRTETRKIEVDVADKRQLPKE